MAVWHHMNVDKFIPRPIKRLISRVMFERRDVGLLLGSPYFDAEWYTRENLDVQDISAVLHYLRHGAEEGRDPSPYFSTSRYVETYPDVKASGDNPLVHYLRWGCGEGRLTFGLHCRYTSAKTRAEELHLLRESCLFDPEWYLSTYPDAAGWDPYIHFLEIGDPEGRRTSSDGFSGIWYLSQYTDVAASGKSPFIHYLTQGRQEGRTPGLTASQRAAILQTVHDVESLDPEFNAVSTVYADPDTLRTNFFYTPLYFLNAWRTIFGLLSSDIQLIIFASGAAPMSLECAEAVEFTRLGIAQYGGESVLVFLTEGACTAPYEQLQSSKRIIALDAVWDGATDYQRQRMVEMLIFSLLPPAVLNAGSAACWSAIAEKGKALGAISAIYSRFFNPQAGPNDSASRAAHTHLRRAIGHVTRLYVPDVEAKRYLVDRYGITPTLAEKVCVLPHPVDHVPASLDSGSAFVDVLLAEPSYLAAGTT